MQASRSTILDDFGNMSFAQWFLALGEGKLPIVNDCVLCPDSMILHEEIIEGLINKNYPYIRAGRHGSIF
jgi:hypothetical protein